MTDYSELSNREVDALVAEKLDGWRCVSGAYGAKLTTMNEEPTSYATREVPHYTADFNEALRVLRAMDEDRQVTVIRRCFVSAYQKECNDPVVWLALEATPREICEAMLEAIDR